MQIVMNMKRLSIIPFLLAVALLPGPATGQTLQDLRLNEIYIKNTDNYTDEYGRFVPWIEVYNTAYNTVDIGGCYLTDDTAGLFLANEEGDVPEHWYRIPKGDPKTAMPQRSYIVFYLDNEPLYGTFHSNIDPYTSKTHYVALISSNGKDLLDIMEYPVMLRDTALSYGALIDDEHEKQGILPYFTPGSVNYVDKSMTKQEKLMRDDPYGFGLAIISIAVVFVALILIYVMLKVFGAVTAWQTRRASRKNPEAAAAIAVATGETIENISTADAEEAAAIAMALHLHFNSMHDEESEVITIEMPSAHYSPWAQKELTMRRRPIVRK